MIGKLREYERDLIEKYSTEQPTANSYGDYRPQSYYAQSTAVKPVKSHYPSRTDTISHDRIMNHATNQVTSEAKSYLPQINNSQQVQDSTRAMNWDQQGEKPPNEPYY